MILIVMVKAECLGPPSLGGATALSSSGAEGAEAEEEAAAEAEVAGSFGRTSSSEWLLSKPCFASCMNAPHPALHCRVGRQTNAVITGTFAAPALSAQGISPVSPEEILCFFGVVSVCFIVLLVRQKMQLVIMMESVVECQ